MNTTAGRPPRLGAMPQRTKSTIAVGEVDDAQSGARHNTASDERQRMLDMSGRRGLPVVGEMEPDRTSKPRHRASVPRNVHAPLAACLAAALSMLFVGHSAFTAGLDDGLAALHRGEYTLAAALFRDSAAKGDAAAQGYLGVLYEEGRGVSKDLAEAARWYRLAAEQGDAEAQFSLGLLYAKGDGVARNDEEAATWIGRAAAQGVPAAQGYLGILYDEGRGVKQDRATALSWYRRAAEAGDADAQVFLGVLYQTGDGLPSDSAEAATWFRRAAEQGNAEAQYHYGVALASGRGARTDFTQAVQWYKRAARQGEARAMFNLGIMFEAGRGVRQDLEQAHVYFSLAAARLPAGDERTRAARGRDDVAKRLTRTQLAEARRRAQAWRAQ